jgi:yecA family protein
MGLPGNMSDKTIADHARLQRCLDGLALPTGAAEVQALLCGLLCGGAPSPQALWLAEILPDGLDEHNLQHRDCGNALLTLYRQTEATLQTPDSALGFQPLLPQDGVALAGRGAELVGWCKGFLYGLGLTGHSLTSLGEEAREGLEDLAEITRLDLDALEDDERQEQALTELVEFVRVAVMLLHMELCDSAEARPPR